MKYTTDIQLNNGLIDLIILRINDLKEVHTQRLEMDEDRVEYLKDVENLLSLALMEKGRQHYK